MYDPYYFHYPPPMHSYGIPQEYLGFFHQPSYGGYMSSGSHTVDYDEPAMYRGMYDYPSLEYPLEPEVEPVMHYESPRSRPGYRVTQRTFYTTGEIPTPSNDIKTEWWKETSSNSHLQEQAQPKVQSVHQTRPFNHSTQAPSSLPSFPHSAVPGPSPAVYSQPPTFYNPAPPSRREKHGLRAAWHQRRYEKHSKRANQDRNRAAEAARIGDRETHFRALANAVHHEHIASQHAGWMYH
eukprot:TRINITY_DN5809_c0_g1_i1.p1 TRINITY_DN5809_c0_g1~~TRINITY_DN5809_c0_g1_i1.p1  ORF type:complete len:238 (-),score=8.38 TRINITY_DN5809_c0_g1_i1:99-812(-)